MLLPVPEGQAFAWPLAFTLAAAVAVERRRRSRLRGSLNRSLHELRRPLQALALCQASDDRGQLERAIDALAGLDRELNGGRPPPHRRVDARTLSEQAVARWRAPALRSGRRLGFAWRAGSAEVICDPDAVARALDNLIVNALEHGAGAIRIEGHERPGCIRVHVSNECGPAPSHPTERDRHRDDPRRGHGLAIVSSVAAEHGGRFAACRHRGGASAVLELPLAPR